MRERTIDSQELGHSRDQGLCSQTMALMIIKTKKEASTYNVDKEQDGKMVLGCKNIKSKVLPNSIKKKKDLPNSKPEKRLKITLFRNCRAETSCLNILKFLLFILFHISSHLFFFHGFRTTCKTDIINLSEKTESLLICRFGFNVIES